MGKGFLSVALAVAVGTVLAGLLNGLLVKKG